MYKNHRICVVIPAFNEEAQIGKVIDAMPDYVDHVIVVNDGSIDKTAEIAMGKGAIVISHEKNRGVGAAFCTGVRRALKTDTDIMLNIDADGQFDPKDMVKLIEPIIENRAGFVTASRFKDRDYWPKMPRAKFIGNRIMANLVSKIIGHKFYDVSCGFRAYSKEALLRLNLFGAYTYTQETFLDLAFKDISIAEIPIKVRGTREHGKSKVASNLFSYGYQTSKIILKTLRDYRPFNLFLFVSVLAFLLGLGLGVFLLIHYIETGAFSPHKWAGFVSGFFIIFGMCILLTGFILDMFARMRQNQEEILYAIKKISIEADHERESK